MQLGSGRIRNWLVFRIRIYYLEVDDPDPKEIFTVHLLYCELRAAGLISLEVFQVQSK